MWKERVPKRILALLIFALLLTGLCRFSVTGPTERGKREYIVKYRETLADLSRAAPFDMVSEEELKSLLHADLLARSAGDRGAEGFDEYYGYGILHLEDAVLLLTGEAPEAPEAPCSFFPEAGPATRLENRTDTTLGCTYLLAEYDETGLCLGVTDYMLTIPAHGTAELETLEETARYEQFVYETETMKPLLDGRKTP